MKHSEKQGRSIAVGLHFTAKEYERLQEKFRRSCFRSFAPFVRDILFNRPITIKYRNESADDFLQEALKIKKELTRVGESVRQAVSTVSVKQDSASFQEAAMMLKEALSTYQEEMGRLNEKMVQIYELWLQR